MGKRAGEGDENFGEENLDKKRVGEEFQVVGTLYTATQNIFDRFGFTTALRCLIMGPYVI